MKNAKGLWVKEATLERVDGGVGLRPGGRGGGLPVLPSDPTLSSRNPKRDSSSRDDSRSRSPSREASRRSAYRGRSRSPESRRRSRSRSGDRHRRERSRDGKEDGRYARTEDRGHRRQTRGPSRERSRPRDRSTSREMSRSRSRDGGKDEASARHAMGVSYGNARAESSERFADAEQDQSEESPSVPSFNAVQVVNRFLEVFSDARVSPEARSALLSEVLGESIVVSSLRTRKTLLASKSAVLDSFRRATSHAAAPSRRVFISSDTQDASSFCFDMHAPGSSPGLGDPCKDTCLLYECKYSVIQAVWGCVDKDLLASLSTLTLARVQRSELWALVLGIVATQLDVDRADFHFHDYTNIEVIG